jgi:hypothetical protein
MNRSLKVFVATMLALSLCLSFGSAFAKKENKPPKAPKPAVTSIELSLTDRKNVAFTPVAANTYTVVTGQKYVAKATVTPAEIKESLRWRSSRPGVANVDSRGNVFCVRPGQATITVSNKSGTVTKSIALNVEKNMASFNVSEHKAVKKIYLKGNILCMDVVLVNSSTEAMTAAPNLEFFLKLPGENEATSQGVKTGRLRAPIAAGATGNAVYRIKKVKAGTISLPGATASCTTP